MIQEHESMVRSDHRPTKSENRVKIYRWYYYFALAQIVLYFTVPLIVFPGRIVKGAQVISALTLGPVVGLFFFLVSTIGLFLDKGRRALYITTMSVMALYLIAVILSWAYIEYLGFLLR